MTSVGLQKARLPRRSTLPKALEAEHKVADAVAPDIRSALDEAHAAALGKISLQRIRDILEDGSLEAVVRAIPWEDIQADLTRRLELVYSEAMKEAGDAHLRLLPVSRLAKAGPDEIAAEFGFSFNLTNPRAQRFIGHNAAILAQDISFEGQRALRSVLVRMFAEGVPPAAAAREIRDIVGLNDRFALAVDNFRRDLGRQGVAQDIIGQKVQVYADRLRTHRALTIARTESIRASAEGQQELWRQAQAEGLLDTNEVRRKWLITADERLCPLCAPIPSSGLVELNEPFTAGNGAQIMSPPVHPNCRCAVRLVFAGEDGEFPATPKPRRPGNRPTRRLKPKIR